MPGRLAEVAIERFFTSGLAQVAYAVADPEHRVAAFIDPRRDIDSYLAWVEEHHITVVAILETHVHADFISGATELAAATGAPIYAGRFGGSQFPHQPLDDGDEVAMGAFRLRALWTPGHTPEHLSYLLLGSGGEPLALFTGDTLFAGEIGRPDLLGEEQTGTLTHQLFETVTEKLAILPEELVVYPGHGPGSPCGKKIGEAAWTTIGQEKRFNYAFQPSTGEEFAAAVMSGMPTPPAYYPILKRINRDGPRLLADLAAGGPLDPDQVAREQEAGALVIDARDAEAFAKEHLPGAVNVGLDGNFATWAGWLTPYERPVVLILPDDGRYAEARRELRRVGIDEVIGFLAGGITAWADSGRPSAGLDVLPMTDLAQELAGAESEILVLDVREPGEWESGHIVGAINLPMSDIVAGEMPALPEEQGLAVICGSGYRSSIAASLLQNKGFSHLAVVPGGMEAWREVGLPVVGSDESEVRGRLA